MAPSPGCTLRRPSAGPRRQRAFASFAARARVFELCIVTGSSARIVRLNFKNSPKIGVQEIFNFFSPKACSGLWAFIKYQVQPYCSFSFGAYSPRTNRQTDGQTDGRTACAISWSRYLITTPSGFDNLSKKLQANLLISLNLRAHPMIRSTALNKNWSTKTE